jgi:type I restriction enzyme S subunit
MTWPAVSPPDWRCAKFDELMERIDRRFLIDDSQEYPLVGVRWYGMGAFVRERRAGVSIRRKQQWVLRAGDVVYNKLFAWKGAFALADTSVDGCLVSDKFPTYAIKRDIVEPRYLELYFRMADIRRQALELSRGGAAISKLTLNPPQFWRLTIPLPQLRDQRRIVARIETLTSEATEARRLKQSVMANAETLRASVVDAALRDVAIEGNLGDVLIGKPRNGWSTICDNMNGGTPVLSLAAVTGYTYRPAEHKLTAAPTDSKAHYWLRKGDLLMSRSNSPALVGHAAIYDGTPAPCVYPDLMMRLNVNPKLADTRFVWYWLQSAVARSHIYANAKGTSGSMKKISQRVIMTIPFPAKLPIPEQRRIMAKLDDLRARADVLRQFQAQTAADLDALMPSILDKAFRGEL